LPTELVAFINNGVELPQVAVYNKGPLQSVDLICVGSRDSGDLQINDSSVLSAGVHFTNEGPIITVKEYDSAVEVRISMANLTNLLELACYSQHPQGALYRLTTGTCVN